MDICTSYSIAAISHHRKKNVETGSLDPVSDFAKLSDELVKHTLELIKELKPKYWFIENPRGGMRKMDFMQGLPRYTVTYCQYGDTRINLRTYGLTTRILNLSQCAIMVIHVMRKHLEGVKQAHKV